MRNLHLEAAIWNLFSSPEFFEAAARECEDIMTWFGTLAVSRQVANFGRNNQIHDWLKTKAADFRRGAELAKLGDYTLIRDMASSIRGGVRGLMEQPLHSWMTQEEYREFSRYKIGRIMAYAGMIESALYNAFLGPKAFFNPPPGYPERANDDDGFPGDEIIKWYDNYVNSYKDAFSLTVPDPLPEYQVDSSTTCQTGDEVPWTGVWYPATGLENYSLTFAIKGFRMQPAYRVIKTKEELKAEGILCPVAKTVAVATRWHPVIPTGRTLNTNEELWAKAGDRCPKDGVW